MTKIYCDRCKKEYEQLEPEQVVMRLLRRSDNRSHNREPTWEVDLCVKCIENLGKWLTTAS